MTETNDAGFFELPLCDGSPAVALELSITPHGTAICYAEDTSGASRQLLSRVKSWWPKLWPAMLRYIEEVAPDLDIDAPLAGDITIAGSLLGPDIYMADKCDTYLSLQGDEGPQWDFFLKDGEILHSQPVF